jgi:hypothetical protein
MTIAFNLTVFHWRIGTFDIHIDIDPATVAAAQPTVDRGVKRITRWWTGHMAS